MPRSNSAAEMGMLCSWLRSICVYLRCLLMELVQGGGDRTGQESCPQAAWEGPSLSHWGCHCLLGGRMGQDAHPGKRS